MIVLIENDNKI